MPARRKATRSTKPPEDNRLGARCLGAGAGGGPPRGGHGGIFPLRLRKQLAVDVRGRRYLARRCREHERTEGFVRRAVRALNALAAGGAHGVLSLAEPLVACNAVPLSSANHAVLSNIGRAVKTCLPAPDPAADFPAGALCELLQSRDIYDVDTAAAAAPYDPTRIKILRGGTRPKEAKFLVGDDAARYFGRRGKPHRTTAAGARCVGRRAEAPLGCSTLVFGEGAAGPGSSA